MPNPELMFTDSEDKPAGRKARVVSAQLWAALEDSAKRDVTKEVTAPTAVIDELRKDLAAAAVRAKFEVTTSTAALEHGKQRLKFIAVAKTGAAAPGPEQPPAPVPGPPQSPVPVPAPATAPRPAPPAARAGK